MTSDEVKREILEIVNRYDRGIYNAQDMDRELHVLAVRVDTEERATTLGVEAHD
jgi:hypothetical protein